MQPLPLRIRGAKTYLPAGPSLSFVSLLMTPPPGPTFFLCHASDDKEAVVRPVKLALEEAGIFRLHGYETILKRDFSRRIIEALAKPVFFKL